MPVIVLASPKGGVGKSTCSIILASEFAHAGLPVTLIDCDSNRSASRWAQAGTPDNVTLLDGVTKSEIVPLLRKEDADGKIIIVDLEGIASQMMSRAISQADLVIIPMQPAALDSSIGGEAIALVREEEETLGRPIKHAVVLTRTNAAMKTRVQKELEQALQDAGIDLIEPPLVQRAAFAELFAFGHGLRELRTNPAVSTAGNIDSAIDNARAFMEAVYERLQ